MIMSCSQGPLPFVSNIGTLAVLANRMHQVTSATHSLPFGNPSYRDYGLLPQPRYQLDLEEVISAQIHQFLANGTGILNSHFPSHKNQSE